MAYENYTEHTTQYIAMYIFIYIYILWGLSMMGISIDQHRMKWNRKIEHSWIDPQGHPCQWITIQSFISPRWKMRLTFSMDFRMTCFHVAHPGAPYGAFVPLQSHWISWGPTHHCHDLFREGGGASNWAKKGRKKGQLCWWSLEISQVAGKSMEVLMGKSYIYTYCVYIYI